MAIVVPLTYCRPCLLAPSPSRQNRSPHHGRRGVRSIRFNLSRGGRTASASIVARDEENPHSTINRRAVQPATPLPRLVRRVRTAGHITGNAAVWNTLPSSRVMTSLMNKGTLVLEHAVSATSLHMSASAEQQQRQLLLKLIASQQQQQPQTGPAHTGLGGPPQPH